MPAIGPFPDIEQLLITWLTADLGGGIRVGTELPLDFAPPAVRVTRISGANKSIRVDRPVVDIDVFGGDAPSANALALRIQGDILTAFRNLATPSGHVQSVTTIIGPRWLPEENEELERYTASYQFSTHA